LRSDVVRELEKLRDAGSIGAPLDAEVDIYCAPDEYARFNALGEELRFLFITSQARVHEVSSPPDTAVLATNTGRGGVWLAVKPSSDPKCIRCWNRRPDVGRYVEHPELCGRCVTNVDGPGELRKYV
jgi:isoleucyl-tRNA synthetase